MASNYPTGLDSFTTNHIPNTAIDAATDNNHADAINKIEAELGINPSDTYSTVKARLDTLGGSSGTSINVYTMQAAYAAGTTVIALDRAPTVPLRVGSKVVLSAYTIRAEIRNVTAVGATSVTVAATVTAHNANDLLLVVPDNILTTEMFGILNDGTNEWAPIQRLITEMYVYGGQLMANGKYIDIQQPLLVPSSNRSTWLTLRSRAGFAPVEVEGAMVMTCYNEIGFTCSAATDTFTTPGNHAMTAAYSEVYDSKVVFYAAYGETLPTPLVAGQVYYINTVPNSTTFTVSATKGGALLNITADGTGRVGLQIDDIARVFWESVRIDLLIANLNGLRAVLQQPAWTRNLRIEMDIDATTTAIGYHLGGQLSYHDNVEVNPAGNTTGMQIAGFGHIVRGFNCNGVNNNEKGLRMTGTANAVHDPWIESTNACSIELFDTVRGCMIGGAWYQTGGLLTNPMLLVTGANASYQVETVHCKATDRLFLSDTPRGITLQSTEVADFQGTFGGMRQRYEAAAPTFVDKIYNNYTASFTVLRGLTAAICAPNAANITATLPTAVGWGGETHTFKNMSGTYTVTLDAFSTQTIDDSLTNVLYPYQSVTIISDGTNWKIKDSSSGTRPIHALPTLNFPSIPANSIAVLTTTVTGAANRDTVTAAPETYIEAGLIWSAFVSAVDTVTIRLANITGAAIDPQAMNWSIDVWKQQYV